MASQVFSGSGAFAYTNNTGQNVRVIINFIKAEFANYSSGTTGPSVNITWAGVTINTRAGSDKIVFGRNLAIANYSSSNNIQNTNAVLDSGSSGDSNGIAAPTEIMLAPGQTFSMQGDLNRDINLSTVITAYNIVVIPEAG